RLDAGGPTIFRMAGTLAFELTEVFEVLQGEGRLVEDLSLVRRFLDAREVNDAVEQHRRVAVRKDEAIAVEPGRIGRVVAQEILPDRVSDRGQGHRRSRVAGVG